MRHLTFLVASLLMMLGADDVNLDVIKQNNTNCGLEGTPGGSEPQMDLNRHKNRYNEPSDSDLDPHVSLPAMLAPGNDVKRFDQDKGARIRGFVINVKVGGVESCNCKTTNHDEMDTHIELALGQDMGKDPPETHRVIVEVTPRIRMLKAKKGIDWKTQALHSEIKGKWVEVTGWMLFDTAHITQAENTHPGNKKNWRATCWEIHPVTDIKILDGPPEEVADFRPDSLTALQGIHAAHVKRSPNGKSAIEKLHQEHLSKFSDDEKNEAAEEVNARRRDH